MKGSQYCKTIVYFLHLRSGRIEGGVVACNSVEEFLPSSSQYFLSLNAGVGVSVN